jgi:hypothetical protein
MSMTDAIGQLCLAVLRKLADRDREALASGKAADWPDYRRRVGRVQMAEEAEAEIIEALRKRFDPDEDEDDEDEDE